MTPFFESKESQENLHNVLESWLGTPFRHWCGVKGSGADCIHFVVRVLQEVGACGDIKIPKYPKDWHLHRSEQLLLEGIISHLNVEKVDRPLIKNGDIILYSFGRTYSHCGIFFDRLVYHSFFSMAGVIKSSFTDPMIGNRTGPIFRVMG